MAERLGRGLQNLVQRFNSASRLHFVTVGYPTVFFCIPGKSFYCRESALFAKIISMNTKNLFIALALATATACAQDATWLPANSTGALSIDYKALRAIPMVAKLIDKNDQAAGAVGVQGISAGQMALIKDLQKDISKILVAMVPGATSAEPNAVSFVSGAFDTAQIAAKLKADTNYTVSTKDGQTVFASKVAGKSSYTVFPSKGLIVTSDNLDALFAGLKTMQKKTPALAADSMISRAVAKNFPLVFVADTSSFAKQGATMPVGGGALPAFCAFTLRAKDTAHLLANLTGVFASEEEATQMATTLNGMKTVYAMQMASNPQAAPLAALLSAISVGSNGKNATASATIDEAMISSLSSLVPNMAVPAAAPAR